MKRLILALVVIGMMFIQGCAPATVSSTPPFPDPEPGVMDKIQNLHDPKVDNWMIKLFKLKKQIEVARQGEDKT